MVTMVSCLLKVVIRQLVINIWAGGWFHSITKNCFNWWYQWNQRWWVVYQFHPYISQPGRKILHKLPESPQFFLLKPSICESSSRKVVESRRKIPGIQNPRWAMVNTHYMVDGHPIHNKDPKIMVIINPILNHWMTSPYEWLLTMSIDHSSCVHRRCQGPLPPSVFQATATAAPCASSPAAPRRNGSSAAAPGLWAARCTPRRPRRLGWLGVPPPRKAPFFVMSVSTTTTFLGGFTEVGLVQLWIPVISGMSQV